MNIENTYFGEEIGWLPIIQLGYASFNQACLSHSTTSLKASPESRNVSKNSEDESFKRATDSTGKRLYSGAHIGIRFLIKHSQVLNGKSVCELGCGIGAFGLVSNLTGNMSTLILTDAEESTLQICRENALQLSQLVPQNNRKNDLHVSSTNIYCELLNWNDSSSIFSDLLLRANNGKLVNIVIGCELMYYRTDVKALVSAVMRLVEPENGLFVHSHLFRRCGQAEELIHHLAQYDWISYEASHRSFISEEELMEHPEWYRVRQLVSGPRLGAALREWKAQNSDWVVFSADKDDDENDYGGSNSGADENDTAGQDDGFSFHSLFRTRATLS